MTEAFGNWDFGLTAEQEERAAKLHRESIVIDTLYQGPCGYRSFTPEMEAQIHQDFERHRNAMKGLWTAVRMPARMAVEDNFPDFEAFWKASGITAGNRQTGGNTLEEAFES